MATDDGSQFLVTEPADSTDEDDPTAVMAEAPPKVRLSRDHIDRGGNPDSQLHFVNTENEEDVFTFKTLRAIDRNNLNNKLPDSDNFTNGSETSMHDIFNDGVKVEDISEDIGPLLYIARKESGISRRALAKRSGIDYKNISLFEAGKLNATSKTIARYMEAAGIRAKIKFEIG